MNLRNDLNYYRTSKIALAPYLAMKKLKYCVGELDSSGKVHFVFQDPDNNGQQLSFDFEKSNLSTYNQIWRDFRAKLDSFEDDYSRGGIKSKENVAYYSTDRLALVPYLVMKELKYSHMEQQGRRKKFFFEDPLGLGQELLMDFERSEEAVYNKYWHIFRHEVDETKKSVKLGLESPRELKTNRLKARTYE